MLFVQAKRGLTEFLTIAIISGHLDLKDGNTTPLRPSYCADLKSILRRTLSLLEYGLLSENAKVSFTCVEKGSREGQYGLPASGRSI